MAAAVAALLPAGSAGAQCTQRLTWQATRYKPVVTRAPVPVGHRLGRGTLVGCSVTRGTARQGGVRRVSVYAVRGVRSQVAVALRPAKPALYVSNARATAAERRVLDRLRGR
jgi:Family of unknown function (DUF6281)